MEHGMLEVYVSKIDATREVDFDKLPEAMQTGIVVYGLRQLLNDKTAGKTDVAEAAAMVDKCLDGLKAGTYSFGTGGGKRADAVEVEAQMIIATALAKKPGVTLTKAREAAKTWRKTMKPEVVEAVLAKARANVKAREFDIEI